MKKVENCWPLDNHHIYQFSMGRFFSNSSLITVNPSVQPLPLFDFGRGTGFHSPCEQWEWALYLALSTRRWQMSSYAWGWKRACSEGYLQLDSALSLGVRRIKGAPARFRTSYWLAFLVLVRSSCFPSPLSLSVLEVGLLAFFLSFPVAAFFQCQFLNLVVNRMNSFHFSIRS